VRRWRTRAAARRFVVARRCPAEAARSGRATRSCEVSPAVVGRRRATTRKRGHPDLIAPVGRLPCAWAGDWFTLAPNVAEAHSLSPASGCAGLTYERGHVVCDGAFVDVRCRAGPDSRLPACLAGPSSAEMFRDVAGYGIEVFAVDPYVDDHHTVVSCECLVDLREPVGVLDPVAGGPQR
jgi:hypothetical protein